MHTSLLFVHIVLNEH